MSSLPISPSDRTIHSIQSRNNSNNSIEKSDKPEAESETVSMASPSLYPFRILTRSCAGNIIFSDKQSTLVVLVETQAGHLGFPKGKPEKKETPKQTANSETDEETGLQATDFMFLDLDESGPLKELNDNGSLSCQLYPCYTKQGDIKIQCANPDELKSVKWWKVQDALKSPYLFERRKILLKKAVELMLNGRFHEEQHDILKRPEKKNEVGFTYVWDKSINPTSAPSENRNMNKYVGHDLRQGVWHANPGNKENGRFSQTMGKHMYVDDKTTLSNPIIQLSKSLSYVLRHRIVDLNLPMDKEGFVKLSDLLMLDKLKGVTLDQIKEVVHTNDKKRFELKEKKEKGLDESFDESFSEFFDQSKSSYELIDNSNNDSSTDVSQYLIRAIQGHSFKVGALISDEIALEELKKPLPVCIHGTYETCFKSIQQQGLSRMKRKHIHCAQGMTTDDTVISGARRSCDVFLHIDMKNAMKDGIVFYKSANGVILTEGINGILPFMYVAKVTRQ
ncbi:MAG: putative tRNA 2'-phosphotransferase [Sylvanvirus sp.]|uniref:Putative tRNA 2'-phosphotransferase n=1 Tax=Sylvanvirus sp. TaxID=2487774 RepID=A0A3G5AJ65_9VIRU|nr:MAG: putative tRNA 2'-phosphotransferase [Sylvanvirus sp.]